jgi:hypothetical protein
MKRKTLLIVFFIATCCAIHAQDYNPYKSIGKKGKILTAYGDRFVEVFDYDTIQRIGSVMFNIRTKKVVRLLPKEKTFKKYSDNSSASRWYQVDPLAAKGKNISYSPYNFTRDNPILYNDPDGKDVYRYDDKTGNLILAKKTDDKIDQIGKFKYDKKSGEYTLRTHKDGTAKTSIDGIEKGILKDGINFQRNDNVIAVGGNGQASVDGVKSFTLQLSEYVGKEISGYSYSADGSKNVTDMVLGKYINNKVDESNANAQELFKKYGANYSDNNILQDFHTHPDGKLGATESDPQLSKDVQRLQGQRPLIPNASFIILYRIAGQVQPGEYDYTHEYKP